MDFELTEGAFELASRGLPVFPVHIELKADGKRSKTPLVKNWRNVASTDHDEIRRLFSLPRANGIGVPMGVRSGLWLLDEDVPGALDGLPLVETLEARTPRPGRHLFFRFDADLGLRCGAPMPGVDIKSEGGFAVMAPTEGYAWTNDCEPVDAPDELVLALTSSRRHQTAPRRHCVGSQADTPYGLAALSDECATLRATEEGSRNNQLNRSAFCIGQLVAGGSLTEDTARRELTGAAEDAGLEPAEIAQTLDSGLPDGMEHPRGPQPGHAGRPMRTDFGNVDRLVRHAGEDLRYCPSLGWLVWDGRRWARDELGRANELAKEAVRHILDEAKTIEDDAERAALAKWGAQSQSVTRLTAVLKLAETHPDLALARSALDRDPLLISCRNGTLDLRSIELRPHQRDDLITKITEVEWNPAARAPRFEKFLERVLPDPEVRDFVQRWFGYCLTGETGEQCFVFLYGTGQNGKSVLILAMQRILGDYAKTAPLTSFLKRRSDSPTNDLASLVGARLVVSSETDEGVRLSEATIKQLTGQDRVSARHLYKEFFEFDPTFKITISGNYKPQVQGTDEGIWRRIRLVPFAVHIPEDERDRNLPQKLMDEAAGILAWAVRGYVAWREGGLREPRAVAEATQEYRSDEDVLGQFVQECLEVDPAASATAKEVNDSYRSWCVALGEVAASQKILGGYLTRGGFERRKRGTYRWHGLRVRPQPPQPALSQPQSPGPSGPSGPSGDKSPHEESD